jgi:hypothetical protein
MEERYLLGVPSIELFYVLLPGIRELSFIPAA